VANLGARAKTNLYAGVLKHFEDILLHVALWQRQVDLNVVAGVRGGHFRNAGLGVRPPPPPPAAARDALTRHQKNLFLLSLSVQGP
jgi:hypothetical protein